MDFVGANTVEPTGVDLAKGVVSYFGATGAGKSRTGLARYSSIAYGIPVGTYDTSRDLVIDPTVVKVYAGFIGGSQLDCGYAIAIDAAGNAYVTGWTLSVEGTFPIMAGPDLTFAGPATDAMPSWPRCGPDGYSGNSDAFVVKIAGP